MNLNWLLIHGDIEDVFESNEILEGDLCDILKGVTRELAKKMSKN